MSGAWETVIGLEVHVQLLTRTKMFCGCSGAYGDPPNTNVCPVCLGLPGALPVPNELAVRLATRAAFALGCTVHPRSVFARKNYFYPDLPKGYQISQFDEPLATKGHLEIASPDRGRLRIGITRLHLEEDAGKSFHDKFPALTAIDLNRSSVPLIEIVSEPDIRSPAEGRAYLKELRQVIVEHGVSNGSMEEGSLRVDANVSVRRPHEALGTRTEVKNMNSFAGVERALEIERDRQIKLIESGGSVVQQTMTFDAAKNEVRAMRSKEESHDYRYFPEPDLPPLVLSASLLKEERNRLQPHPLERNQQLQDDYALSPYDASALSATVALAEYFKKLVGIGVETKDAANWILNDVLTHSDGESVPEALTPERIAEVVALTRSGTVSRQAAKKVLAEMLGSPEPATAIAQRLGLVQVQDTSAIDSWVAETLAAHPGEVARYKAGEVKLMGFFTGQVMKRSKGKADPKAVGAALGRALG